MILTILTEKSPDSSCVRNPLQDHKDIVLSQQAVLKLIQLPKNANRIEMNV